MLPVLENSENENFFDHIYSLDNLMYNDDYLECKPISIL